MENEIQKIEPAPPSEMIKLALESNADLEKLEKLLDLQIRYETNEARKVFSSDFAVVQANIAAVTKTKTNPQTHSKYAGLENVLEISKPVYTEQGFSVAFYEGKTEVAENIRVCADVLHRAGHKETYHFDVPLDGKGIKGNVNMTKIHGKASSVSYGRRYLLCMIWNIPTQDDDGNNAGNNKTEIPEMTEINKTVLSAICVRLQDSFPDDKVVDADKVAAIFLAQKGCYPANINQAGIAVAWLISLNQTDSWTKQAKSKPKSKPKKTPSDEILDVLFSAYKIEHQDKLDEGESFVRGKFVDAVSRVFNGIMPDSSDALVQESVNGQVPVDECIIKV